MSYNPAYLVYWASVLVWAQHLWPYITYWQFSQHWLQLRMDCYQVWQYPFLKWRANREIKIFFKLEYQHQLTLINWNLIIIRNKTSLDTHFRPAFRYGITFGIYSKFHHFLLSAKRHLFFSRIMYRCTALYKLNSNVFLSDTNSSKLLLKCIHIEYPGFETPLS